MTDSSQRPRPLEYNPPQIGDLPVLFADEQILVLDKPSGLLTVPGNTPEKADCLERRARADYPYARIVHRLDMDTSGVMVMALTAEAQAHIGRQFEQRQTEKSYIANVWGQVAEACGEVDQPLITDWPNRPKQHVDPVNGRQAITKWQVVEKFAEHCRVQLSPVTGRSHQLRVHMQHIGHPILGDNLYAHADALAVSDRLCLHAERLAFAHPASGETIVFESAPSF
ncbi:MAG: pseudouridine synthase [Hyphobacterium sp.]|nr:MAG: pseudouridine synthase [Hyphobacterium sp.]